MWTYHEKLSSGNANPGSRQSTADLVQASTNCSGHKESQRCFRVDTVCAAGPLVVAGEEYGRLGGVCSTRRCFTQRGRSISSHSRQAGDV